MPRVTRHPGSGKAPVNTPARGAGHGGPARGAGHGGPASGGGGYGGRSRGPGNGNDRAAPFTPQTASELAARAWAPEAEARQAARLETVKALTRQQLIFALVGVPDAAKCLVADKVIDRFMGRATQVTGGDAARPQVIRVITGVPRPQDDILAIEDGDG